MTDDLELYFGDESVARVVEQLRQKAVDGAQSWDSIPAFASSACGAGFSEEGARIAVAMENLRAHGKLMYGGLAEFAPAVQAQWQQLSQVDQGASARLRSVLEER